MKTFYRPVNCRSRKDMTEYLREHFRYPTMKFLERLHIIRLQPENISAGP